MCVCVCARARVCVRACVCVCVRRVVSLCLVQPSLIDKEGNTVDATQIVNTYKALSGGAAIETDGSKDEL